MPNAVWVTFSVAMPISDVMSPTTFFTVVAAYLTSLAVMKPAAAELGGVLLVAPPRSIPNVRATQASCSGVGLGMTPPADCAGPHGVETEVNPMPTCRSIPQRDVRTRHKSRLVRVAFPSYSALRRG